jgi:hypothetical protein
MLSGIAFLIAASPGANANAARPPKTDIVDTLEGHWFTNRAGDALAMRDGS